MRVRTDMTALPCMFSLYCWPYPLRNKDGARVRTEYQHITRQRKCQDEKVANLQYRTDRTRGRNADYTCQSRLGKTRLFDYGRPTSDVIFSQSVLATFIFRRVVGFALAASAIKRISCQFPSAHFMCNWKRLTYVSTLSGRVFMLSMSRSLAHGQKVNANQSKQSIFL